MTQIIGPHPKAARCLDIWDFEQMKPDYLLSGDPCVEDHFSLKVCYIYIYIYTCIYIYDIYVYRRDLIICEVSA